MAARRLVGVWLWLTPGATYGQSRELVDAYNRTGALYGQGRYEEALPLAKKAVRLGEQEFEANHPTFAIVLNNLALLYGARGRYSEAEPRYERALAIKEKSLGSEHPNVAVGLNNLASLYDWEARNNTMPPRR